MVDGDDELQRELHRAGYPPVGPVPLASIRKRGERLRLRRRLIAAGALAVTATVVVSILITGTTFSSAELPASESATPSTARSIEPTPSPSSPRTREARLECESANSAEPTAGEVLVFFSCGYDLGQPIGRLRNIAPGLGLEAQLRAAVVAYLQGSTPAESGRGYISAFGRDAQNLLNEVQIDSTGRAVIDLDLEAAGYQSTTSFQSSLIWSQLKALAFQFEAVIELEPRFNGSCERFGFALQAGVCLIAERGGGYTEEL